MREIDWIEAEDNYARIWTGAASRLLREPIGALERRVGGGFIRTHRRALVRLDAVRTIASERGGEIHATLQSGAKVPVSRRRRAMLFAAIRQRRPP